jgi:hypothetical protein
MGLASYTVLAQIDQLAAHLRRVFRSSPGGLTATGLFFVLRGLPAGSGRRCPAKPSLETPHYAELFRHIRHSQGEEFVRGPADEDPEASGKHAPVAVVGEFIGAERGIGRLIIESEARAEAPGRWLPLSC